MGTCTEFLNSVRVPVLSVRIPDFFADPLLSMADVDYNTMLTILFWMQTTLRTGLPPISA